MAKTKYKIMVRIPGQGLNLPLIKEIRKKRFNTKAEAQAFCDGINIYRAANAVKVTTTFVPVADTYGREDEEALEDA